MLMKERLKLTDVKKRLQVTDVVEEIQSDRFIYFYFVIGNLFHVLLHIQF